MVEWLSLRNFRVLRDVEVKLRPFTLLVGPNASGKSSLLLALEFLTHYLASPARNLFAPSEEYFLSRAPNGRLALSFKGRFAETDFSLTLGPDQQIRGRWGAVPLPISYPLSANLKEQISNTIRAATKLNLEVRKLAAPSPPKTTSILPPDGEGLPSILAGLYLERPARFRALVDQLKKIVPGVLDIRFKRVPLQEVAADEIRFDMLGAEDVPASMVSDGTLLTLGLLATLWVESPQLVLIDELERGLHPKALGDLVAQLRELQRQLPELQIVATSHSPYLLDHFDAGEILLTALDQEGYAVVKPLTAHPDYESWKEVMAPGEFWSTVGESWITESAEQKASVPG